MNKYLPVKSDNKIFSFTLLALLVLFVVLYFYQLGSIGLIDVDEPRYAEAAREMLESNNWIVPYFNYEPRYDKPVFFYWLLAISMKLFGVSEFSARLPSALSSLLCSLAIFLLVRTFYGTITAMLCTLVLMSSFEFICLSRFSITDMALTSFLTLAIISFFLGYNHLITSHRFFKFQIIQFSWWFILAFLFLAFAFLTKGPVALVIVGMILIPFFWWIGKLDYFYKSYSFWLGFFLFLLMVCPWYVAVHFKTNGEFTRYFFGIHNFSRYTSVVSGHKGSFFYFVPVVLLGFLPWTFFLPQAFTDLLKKGLKSLLHSPKDQLLWFCLWWFLVVFVFFSFSKTKLLTYILPVFPPLSIITCMWLDDVLKKYFEHKGLIIGLGVFFLFSLVLFYLCAFKLDLIFPREVKLLKLDLHFLLFVFVMLVGVSMAWVSSRKDGPMTVLFLLSTFLILYFCLVSFLLPKIDNHSQYLLRMFARSIPQSVEVATYQIIKPSLVFYSGRHIEKIDSFSELRDRLNQDKKFAFVTKKKLLENISLEHSYLWGEDKRYVIYTNYPDRDGVTMSLYRL